MAIEVGSVLNGTVSGITKFGAFIDLGDKQTGLVHISEVAHMGISKLASECFVSPATISRFCRTLGYENYAHLKQECAWFSSTSRKFNNLINVPLDMMKDHPEESTAYYSQQICTSLSQLSSYLDWNVIDEVLKLIHDRDNAVP